MADAARPLTIGFPRMHKEAGERRDFLPPLVGLLTALGAEVHIETGMGSGMGYADHDYMALSPDVHVTDEDGAYRQDVVVVLRAPEGRYQKMRSGAVLVSMLHFATRPARVALLRDLGIDAISMDLVANDEGRRLVENLRSVAWNGVGAAFAALERTWPGLTDPHRPPVRVTIMGAGTVGKHAVEFATKYGDDARNEAYMRFGLPGVEVVTTGRNLTQDPAYFRARLAMTDLLVDATQRRDPSVSIVRNEWIGLMPPHAVLCDLIVDPYLVDVEPAVVRGIEGIPQGNLDQWEFAPDDSPGMPCRRRFPPHTAGRWCRATRGRACAPNPACTCTAPSWPRCSRRWCSAAAWTASRRKVPSTPGRCGGAACAPGPRARTTTCPMGRCRRGWSPGRRRSIRARRT
jgi:alanine dehydrogenase